MDKLDHEILKNDVGSLTDAVTYIYRLIVSFISCTVPETKTLTLTTTTSTTTTTTRTTAIATHQMRLLIRTRNTKKSSKKKVKMKTLPPIKFRMTTFNFHSNSTTHF